MTKILVIEDDLLALATTAMGLQAVGYTVLKAQNGALALEICECEVPDLALVDIRMPGMSGFEVAKVLTEKKIPVVFLSAYSDAEMAQTAAISGAYGYLIKPIDVPKIVPVIEVVLLRADGMNKAEQYVENLSYALNNNFEVDVAIGLLMEQYAFNRVSAFGHLRNYARSHRVKIADVANKLVAGEVLQGFDVGAKLI
jgi:response regulator NasT